MSRKFEDSPLLTDQLQGDFVKALSRTWYLAAACDLVGVERTTVWRWIKKGRQEPASIYGRFRNAVKKAMTEQEAEALERIKVAEEWQAAAWLLERRNPERWGRDRGKINELEAAVKEILRERETDAARQGSTTPLAATGNGKRR